METDEKSQAFSHLGKAPLLPRCNITCSTSPPPCYRCRLHSVPLVKQQAMAVGCSQVIAVPSLLFLPSCSSPVLHCDCSTLVSSFEGVRALSWAHPQAAVPFRDVYAPSWGLHRQQSVQGVPAPPWTTSSSSFSELLCKPLEQCYTSPLRPRPHVAEKQGTQHLPWTPS